MRSESRANNVRPYNLRGKRLRIMLTVCTSNSQKATLQIQERTNKGVCKPKADSEERAIPPGGLNEFSPGQCFSEWEKIDGRTMFAPTVTLFKQTNQFLR